MKIDGKNTEMLYGLKLLESSFQSLFAYPKLKDVPKNDWAEFDHLEVDLSAPKLASKEVQINLLCDFDKYKDFSNFILSKTYHNYQFELMNVVYTLRFDSFEKVEVEGNVVLFTMKLYDDKPLKDYIYTSPELTAHNFQTFLDGKNLTKYGINVIKGTKTEVFKKGGIRVPLVIENKLMNGAKVADNQLFYKEQSFELHLFMHLTKQQFLQGYFAFLYDLTKPNPRVINYEGEQMDCYYNSSSVSYFSIHKDKVWIEFKVELIRL